MAQISFAVTAKLICVFVFAYADCWFSHEAAQICILPLYKVAKTFFSWHNVMVKLLFYGIQVNRPQGYKTFVMLSCSVQLRRTFILLMNVKMPTIVDILTFIGKINYRLWSSKPSISIYLGYFAYLLAV